MTDLILNELKKIYDGKKVVNNVNIKVKKGSVTGLLGPNGAGKTTTFYMAVGLIKPDAGNVFLDNENITEYPMYIRARKGIGYLPQEPSTFKKLTVKQNITAILEVLYKDTNKINNKADKIMDELGISHLKNQKALSLSGGERRRLEISRVLATNPMFILLDEPFAGIDPLAVIDIQKIISQLTQKEIGVLISDHNVRETLGVCDFAYIMSKGEVIETGNPEKITSSQIAKENYLGENFRL
jgi:lipopolysaccharide export system ATP-binding protein